MSNKATSSTNPEELPLHPALRSLARAIAAYRRAGWKEDEEAFRDWAMCHFDQDDYDRAFREITALPELESADKYFWYADRFLRRTGYHLKQNMIAGDTFDLWMDEIKLYIERKNDRRMEEEWTIADTEELEAMLAEVDDPVGTGQES